MTRSRNKLSTRFCAKTDLKKGKHADGGGLYLNVSSSGSKSWLFLWVRNGKRREMGLGSAEIVTLPAAREKAREAEIIVSNGLDPIVERDRKMAADSFCVFRGDPATDSNSIRPPIPI